MINNIVFDRNYGPDEYVRRSSRKHTRHERNKTACIIIRAYDFNDLKNQKNDVKTQKISFLNYYVLLFEYKNRCYKIILMIKNAIVHV